MVFLSFQFQLQDTKRNLMKYGAGGQVVVIIPDYAVGVDPPATPPALVMSGEALSKHSVHLIDTLPDDTTIDDIIHAIWMWALERWNFFPA